MILSKTATDPLADEPFLAALRSAGATSPDDAVRRDELPEISDDMLTAFLSAEMVRRAGSEHYYLVVRSRPRRAPATFTPMSVALMSAFWVFALLAPLVIWLIAR